MLRAISVVFVSLALTLVLPVSQGRASDGYKHYYKVKKGDTLGKIAKRLKVSVKRLRRWNRLRGSKIRAGKKLVYYSATPKRPKRTLIHVVKRGDTLSKLAKRYKTTKRKIKRRNRIRKWLRVGQKLKITVAGPAVAAKSNGRPQYGRLVDAEQLNTGPGWHRMRPHRSWGANNTITHLMTCIPRVKQEFGRATPDVVVGDISRKTGGHLSPHISHQNGLDVDIGYYHKDRPNIRHFRNAGRKSLDVERSWHLIKCFLDTKDVDLIFVDYNLQRLLHRYAKKQGASKAWLKATFQFPRGRGNRKGTIRHSKGHKHHFHVRFKNHVVEEPPNQTRAKRRKPRKS